jgi:TolB protein
LRTAWLSILTLAALAAFAQPDISGDTQPPPPPPPPPPPGVVVFSTLVGPDAQIAVMNEDGANRRPLVPRACLYPSLSSDGKRVAYCASVDNTYQVFVANVDGTHETQVTRGATSCWSPAFAGDNHLVYVGTEHGNMNLVLINVDGAGQRALTTDPADDLAPRVSRGGKLVAFARRTTPDVADIWVLNLATGAETQVTTSKARSWGPSFSRDGAKLIFYSNVTGTNQLYIRDLAAKVTAKVSPDAAQADVNGRFAPDGRIIFVRGNGDARRLWIMNPDGTGAVRLSGDATTDYDPDCGPG